VGTETEGGDPKFYLDRARLSTAKLTGEYTVVSQFGVAFWTRTLDLRGCPE
jgi:hypothetical protein